MAEKTAAEHATLLAAIDKLVRLVTENDRAALKGNEFDLALRLDAEVAAGCDAYGITIPPAPPFIEANSTSGLPRMLVRLVRVGRTGILATEDGGIFGPTEEWALRMRSLRIAMAAATGK